MRATDRLTRFQAVYYLATGLWPLAHMPSFELVAGRKRDDWLVRTVGVLVAAIGAGLGLAAARREVSVSLGGLALLSAVGLAGIDVYYAGRGRIRRVYLLDAVIEIALAALWARSLARPQISTIASISIGMPNGSSAMPTADRAWSPRMSP